MTKRITPLSLALAATLLVALVVRDPLAVIVPSPSTPRPCHLTCTSPRALSTVTADATSTPDSIPAVPTPPFVLPPAALTPGALPNIQAAINLKRELNHEPDAFGPHAGQPVVLPTTVALQAVVPMVPPTPSPNECGAWAVSNGAVGSIITARFGEIRDCGLYGTQWVISTLGSLQQPSVIAVYQCSTNDTGCLNGQTPHSPDGWQSFTPPYQGSVKVLGALLPNSDVLPIENGGYQICFHLRAHTFGTTSATC